MNAHLCDVQRMEAVASLTDFLASLTYMTPPHRIVRGGHAALTQVASHLLLVCLDQRCSTQHVKHCKD